MSRPHVQSCTSPTSASVPTSTIMCTLCGQWLGVRPNNRPTDPWVWEVPTAKVSMKKEIARLLFLFTSIRRFSFSGSAKKFLFSSKSRSTSVSSTPWLDTACANNPCQILSTCLAHGVRVPYRAQVCSGKAYGQCMLYSDIYRISYQFTQMV